VLLEEDSGPTSAKTNLENIPHKGESATHEMEAILKEKKALVLFPVSKIDSCKCLLILSQIP